MNWGKIGKLVLVIIMLWLTFSIDFLGIQIFTILIAVNFAVELVITELRERKIITDRYKRL